MQYVFGVRSIARDAVSRAEDQTVVGLEHPLDVIGDRSNGFLPDRELQWAPPLRSHLRTGGLVYYYAAAPRGGGWWEVGGGCGLCLSG